jgi:hypothetical protein
MNEEQIVDVEVVEENKNEVEIPPLASDLMVFEVSLDAFDLTNIAGHKEEIIDPRAVAIKSAILDQKQIH